MSTTNTIENRYYLKSIHAEIDFFDRRLAHLLKYDTFATEAARATAARKLSLKRDALVVTAKKLTEEGVEFRESELPRSFRPDGVKAPAEVPVEVEAAPVAVAETAAASRGERRPGGAFADAAREWEKSIAAYNEAKKA